MCRVKRHGRPKVRGLGQGGRQFQPSFEWNVRHPLGLGKHQVKLIMNLNIIRS
jgi:hypothetical protein